MRKLQIMLVAALIAVIAAPAFAGKKGAANSDSDPAVTAIKRMEAWQEKKVSCYEKAGMKEGMGKHFWSAGKTPEGLPRYAISDRIWFDPAVDQAAAKKCLMLGREKQ